MATTWTFVKRSGAPSGQIVIDTRREHVRDTYLINDTTNPSITVASKALMHDLKDEPYLVLQSTSASGSGPTVTANIPDFVAGTNYPAGYVILHGGVVQYATVAFQAVGAYSAGDWTTIGGGSSGVTTFNARSGPITLLKTDIAGTGLSAADIGADGTGAAAAVLATSAQKTANLSDLASAGTARYNLHSPDLTPAAVVATSNVALSGLLTIDGYTLLAGDHVLVTAQTTGSQNGPWIAAAGAWTRPATYPTTGSIGGATGGTRSIDIIQGTLGGGGRWQLKTNVAITVDTTATTWAPQQPLSVESASSRIITAATAILATDHVLLADATGSPSPTGLAAVPSAGGGTFAPGNYYWAVTATGGASGESLGSVEATAAVALNGKAALTWTDPAGVVTGHKVYRSTTQGGEGGATQLVATLGAVTTYTDTGTALSAGGAPASNGGAFSQPLPTAVGFTNAYTIEAITSTTNLVTLTTTGGQTIEGAATLTLGTQASGATYASVKLVSDGANWRIISGKSNTPMAILPASPALKTLAYSAHARAEADQSLQANLTPTFTLETASSLTGPVTIVPATAGVRNVNAPWAYEGWDTTVYSNAYIVPLQGTENGARVASGSYPYQIVFDFDGQAFEFSYLPPGGGGSVRVWANEQASAYQALPSSGNGFLKVDFGSRAQRRIIIEADYGLYLKGIIRAATDSITAPTRQSGTLKFAVVGDSFSCGAGVNSTLVSAQGYPFVLARLLGFTEWRCYGVSGTGFLNAAGAAATYRQRIADVLAYQPDVVLLEGSTNDGTSGGLGTLGPEIATYVAALRAGLPSTSQIIACSVMPMTNTQRTSCASEAIDLKSQFAALGIPYIDGYNAGGTGWFYGTGKVGATTGDGNADYYQSSVTASHPSIAGHDYMARRLAAGMLPYLPAGL